MVSLILTGLFQITVAIKMICKEPHNKHLQIYTISVILFFLLVIMIYKLELYHFVNFIIFGIPPFLAIYLSIIIYKKAQL